MKFSVGVLGIKGKQELKDAWDQASLLVVFRTTCNGECLSRPCLAVCKHRAIVALNHAVDVLREEGEKGGGGKGKVKKICFFGEAITSVWQGSK